MPVPPVLNFAMLKVCTTFLQRVYTLYDLATGESRSRIRSWPWKYPKLRGTWSVTPSSFMIWFAFAVSSGVGETMALALAFTKRELPSISLWYCRIGTHSFFWAAVNDWYLSHSTQGMRAVLSRTEYEGRPCFSNEMLWWTGSILPSRIPRVRIPP